MFDIAQLTLIVGMIFSLSVATERLVEIIKGSCAFLSNSNVDPRRERRRKLALHVIAVVAGIVTTWLSLPVLPLELAEHAQSFGVIGLGLLASGGSGFWNALLTYLVNIKNREAHRVALMRDSTDPLRPDSKSEVAFVPNVSGRIRQAG